MLWRWISASWKSSPNKEVEALKLAHRQELGRLQLELQEAREKLEVLRSDVKRSRNQASGQSQAAVDLKVQELLTPLTGPLSQLQTAVHQADQGERPLSQEHVLLLVRQLLQGLQSGGVRFIGSVGEVVEFDPQLHEPLSVDTQMAAGVAVRILFAGLQLEGRRLRRAGVEPVSSNINPAKATSS